MVEPQSASVDLANVDAWEDVEHCCHYENPEKPAIKDEWWVRRPSRKQGVITSQKPDGKDYGEEGIEEQRHAEYLPAIDVHDFPHVDLPLDYGVEL